MAKMMNAFHTHTHTYILYHFSLSRIHTHTHTCKYGNLRHISAYPPPCSSQQNSIVGNECHKNIQPIWLWRRAHTFVCLYMCASIHLQVFHCSRRKWPSQIAWNATPNGSNDVSSQSCNCWNNCGCGNN